MTAKKKTRTLRITQIRSGIGHRKDHRAVLKGLGLGKIGRTVERPDDPCIRGMVAKVDYLLRVEEVEG